MNRKKLIAILYLIQLYSSYDVTHLPWIECQDSDVLDMVQPYLPKNPIILEAGVCDGTDNIKMKEKWPQSILYGFEPVPKNYNVSKKNTAHIKDFYLFPYALGDRSGVITFYESTKNSGASSFLPDNLDYIEMPKDIGHDGVNYRDVAIQVPCITLNDWAKKNTVNTIDYIWLDAEGAELSILSHATEILHIVKVISLEANFKEFRKGTVQFSDLYDFLMKQGFILKYIWGRPDWQATAIFINSRFNKQV